MPRLEGEGLLFQILDETKMQEDLWTLLIFEKIAKKGTNWRMEVTMIIDLKAFISILFEFFFIYK